MDLLLQHSFQAKAKKGGLRVKKQRHETRQNITNNRLSSSKTIKVAADSCVSLDTITSFFFPHFSDVAVHEVEIFKKGKKSNAPGKASTCQPLKMLFKSLLILVYLDLICQTIIKSSSVKSVVVHGPPTSKSPGLLAKQVHLTGTY